MGKHVAILYNRRLERAKPLAEQYAGIAERLGMVATLGPAVMGETDGRFRGADLVVSVGGDGTILRASRVAVELGVPIVGVNLGELGFMAELQPDEAFERLPGYFDGQGWLEKRSVLQVDTFPEDEPETIVSSDIALNEVLLGRGAQSRIVKVRVTIDGAPFTTYVADGVLVASATGSTAYALAAGGPVLEPSMSAVLLTPLLPYLSFNHPLVLPASVTVTLHLFSGYEALTTIDGQIEQSLRDGHALRVSVAPTPCLFLRQQPRNYFWASLTKRLRYRKQGD